MAVSAAQLIFISYRNDRSRIFYPMDWTARRGVFFAALARLVRGTATNSLVDGIVGLILNVRQPHARGSPCPFFRKINPTNRIS
jgi:hypothetical protein